MVIALSAVLSLVLTGAFIQLATRRGWGKSVRSDGPASHMGKSGTPTMGGAAVLVATLVLAVSYGGLGEVEVALLLVLVAAGAVGLLDDLASLRRKSLRAMRQANDEATVDEATGVLARYRILAHGVRAAGFAIWAVNAGYLTTGNNWLDILLYTLVMVGSINAFNFTDGLDGLAGGVSVIVLVFFLGGLLAVGAPLAAALLGALLGFLWYNAHPARVFMGGVGAEAIGAVVAALAIVQGHVFLLPLVAIIPVLEVLSVIAQVSYFRATGGKRLLKMSPLHHHFELAGLGETKITVRFWLVTAVAVAVALSIAGTGPLSP
ncbi:MAG TPA: phospho-N-acetylmuramoyl-pentapeptide-transferase [Trueperaceae bacterium]|nr:phospho-N-acetylmuramoyl-pentapeptide-transferase [Trueperaceae bacterium]